MNASLAIDVIPALSRNPEIQRWIPAFAGMTKCDSYFLETAIDTLYIRHDFGVDLAGGVDFEYVNQPFS